MTDALNPTLDEINADLDELRRINVVLETGNRTRRETRMAYAQQRAIEVGSSAPELAHAAIELIINPEVVLWENRIRH